MTPVIAAPESASVPAPRRAAYQGVPGAFGDEAVRRLWNGEVESVGVPSFAAALEALVNGTVDRAVIPTWNSTIGDIAPACAAIATVASRLQWESELAFPVRHNLLALPGTRLENVHWVGSHPAALGQCSRLFEAPSALRPCEAGDTASAAQELACLPTGGSGWYDAIGQRDGSRLAVIASAEAGRLYQLTVLRADVQDDRTNATRFTVYSRR